jgi:GNAT superfamily N-acetyltransferase
MQLADVEEGLNLCRAAGWNQNAGEWELFLRNAPAGCLVSIGSEGQITGSVTTVRYQDHFAWISMLLVFPEFRNQGIGQQLLQGARELLSDVETVKLDATPAGRAVYLRNSFHDEFDIARFICPQWNAQPGLMVCEPVNAAVDLDTINAIDSSVFGAERLLVLDWLLKNAPDLAFLKRDENNMTAYCFGRRGFSYNHIGPVVAPTIGDAKDLVVAALGNCDNRPVIIDIPHPTSDRTGWLTSLGFLTLRNFTRMYNGPNNWPGRAAMQFAVAGPEFG